MKFKYFYFGIGINKKYSAKCRCGKEFESDIYDPDLENMCEEHFKKCCCIHDNIKSKCEVCFSEKFGSACKTCGKRKEVFGASAGSEGGRNSVCKCS